MKLKYRIERLEERLEVCRPIRLTVALLDSILNGTINDGAFSRLPADGSTFRTAEDRFGLVQQLLAVLTQGAILSGQLVGCILHNLPAALVKILALVHQLLT